MEFIRDFKKLDKNNISLAGGKGASLGEMMKAGLPVPPGFVILSLAFENFLKETGLSVRINAIINSVNHKKMHTVENASKKIKALILGTEMPENIADEIKKFFKKLDAKYVAVRSSATVEDSTSAAWAGQLESFLNTTEENLLENVKKCWASLFTQRAIFYRFEKDLQKHKISVAVVVQKMVESEKSGIAFSVHPVTQDKNQLIIEAGFGLGEAIVSGQITPDSYIVEKKHREIIHKNVQIQLRGIYRAKNGGNKWANIPKKQGAKQVLSNKEIIKLSNIVISIENHYKFPCDIEWAYEKGKFYITQSRPITTLIKKSETQKKSNDYVKMFESTGMPFLISSIFFENYKKLKVVLIFKDNRWTTFLSKSIQEETLKEGADLFGSEILFKKYLKEFENYIKNSKEYFQKIISKQKISKTELKDFFKLVSKFWFYYEKTEFFFIDDAFKKSRKNKIIRNNLKQIENIKNSGRKHLNNMVFGKSSFLAETIKILSKNFKVPVNELFFYSKEEIIDLYGNKKVKKYTLKNRNKAYVFLAKYDKRSIFCGKEADIYASKFLAKYKSGEKNEGIVANAGKVRGRAKVIFYGADTFDKVRKIIKDMKKGDILVAETTSPEILPACKKASAILTNQGGLLSHAAIVSRELNIPCIVGLNDITHIIKSGDLLEVDANNGIVRILKKKKQ